MITPSLQFTPSPPPPPPSKQPLPPNPYTQETQPRWYHAYQEAFEYQDTDGMRGRLLGYLLLLAPTDAGRDYIAESLAKCEGDHEMLRELSQIYIDCLIRLFKKQKEIPTLESSTPPSNPAFEVERQITEGQIVPPPKNHKGAREQSLYRDNYHCVITGLWDWESFNQKRQLTSEPRDGVSAIPTEVAYIFPPSTNAQIDDPGKRRYASVTWDIVKMFGGIDGIAELTGTNAHRLSNAMTMRGELHQLFDKLDFWLEEVPEMPGSNTYYACASDKCLSHMLPRRVVTLSTETGFDLPDPRYLKLHATVCRIAHLSGAAGYIDNLDWQHEKAGILAYDGSSAEYLISCLRAVSV